MSQGSFLGKVAIITGGGSGIGRSVALQLAAQGASIAVVDLNLERANEVAEDARECGVNAVALVGDVSDPSVVEYVMGHTIEMLGPVQILVNNAGVMDDMSAPHEATVELWQRVIDVNLTAPFLLTRTLAGHFLNHDGGVIVNVASEAGLRGSAAGVAYTTSKHGLIGLTKSSALLYRDHGIRVNAVAPGGVATNLEVHPLDDALGVAALSRYQATIGRIAQADEIAAAIVFLASDAASNISGAVLPVDGGWAAV